MTSHAQADSGDELAVSGFAGQMLGASLPDLIQMQCLTMVTRAVRVNANSVTGRIYFAGGQVVHASVGMLSGEPALFEMLSWKNGTFTCEDGIRAPEETVTRHWQGILLDAAQREDELREEAEGNDKSHHPSVISLANNIMRKHPIETLQPDPEVIGFVQSDAEGTLLYSKGEDPENLQAGLAYVCGLLQLIGTSLGLDNLNEIHLSGKSHKALCLLEQDVSTVVLTSPKVNLAALAKQLS